MYFYSLGPQSFTSGCFFATHYLSTRACSGWQSTFVPNLLSFIWWWSRRDSNSQPSQCHWVTLPIGATVPYRYETKELNLTNGLWSHSRPTISYQPYLSIIGWLYPSVCDGGCTRKPFRHPSLNRACLYFHHANLAKRGIFYRNMFRTICGNFPLIIRH